MYRALAASMLAALACVEPLTALAEPADAPDAPVVAQAAPASQATPAAAAPNGPAASPAPASAAPAAPAPGVAASAAPAQVDVVAQIRVLQSEINALYQRSLAEQRQQQILAQQLQVLNGRLISLQQQLVGSNGGRRVPLTAVPPQAAAPGPAQSPQVTAVAPPPAEPGPVNGTPVPLNSVATPPPNAARRAPTASSVETVYQSQNALFSRGLTFTPSFTQVYSDNRFFTLNGFLALGAIFLGNINVAQQRNDLLLANAGFTEGITPRFQLALNVPVLYRGSNYSTVGANGSGAQPSEVNTSYTNFGDTSFGMYYQIATERASRPSIVLNAQLTMPTGKSPYGIKIATDTANTNLMYPQSLSTGQGVYDVSFGTSFVKTVDPAIFFGGINYYHNIPGSFADISTTVGQTVPGTAVPGEAFAYNFGTAFALNERTSLSFSLQDTVQGQTRLRATGGPWTNVLGSETNAAVFDVGTSYALDRRTSVSTQLGIGMTRDAPNFQFGVRVPRRF